MDKNRIKLEELCSFICKEINLKLKPSTCQNRSVNKESNVVSEIKSIRNTTNNNIINKLLNRQIYGEFSVHRGVKNEAPFIEIPDYLKFCLRTEILPTHVITENHVYMGLTACGQFLLSYTERWGIQDPEEHEFRSEYLEYKLYFWGFRPHHPCYIVHSVNLFNKESFDHYQNITMVQWKSMPWLLVIHGNNDCARNGCTNNDCEHISHITWTAVPSLGCASCKKESTYNKDQKGRVLCTKHNILAHTKYDCGFEPLFKPHVNMRSPGKIVISTGALMHVLDLQLLTPHHFTMEKSCNGKYSENSAGSSKNESECSISDLLDMSLVDTYKISDELIKSDDNNIVHDIKESKNIHKADKTYEFVEETENCEKISIFRKRRLADRRYEFQEDTFADYFGLKWNKYMKLGANTNKVLYETTNANYQRSQSKTLNILNDSEVQKSNNFKDKLNNSSSKSTIPEYIMNSPLSFRRKSLLVLEDKDNYKCSITHLRYFAKRKLKYCDTFEQIDDDISMILDDQLPSGFHYSLPLSVSNFQIVTQEESNNLIKKEPILAVTQQSFDLENFSYLVSCKLCEKEKKYFKCIQDWYSEILKVSPISGITCVLLLHVVAIPSLYRRPMSSKRCEQCIAGDCVVHREHYEASCLFQWDPTTGYYAVISHTSLNVLEPDKDSKKPQMWRPNRKQASMIIESVEQDNIGWNTRVQYTLNTEFSLESITDWDHYIQLNRGHIFISDDSTDDWSE